jgi:hypothetical protein
MIALLLTIPPLAIIVMSVTAIISTQPIADEGEYNGRK